MMGSFPRASWVCQFSLCTFPVAHSPEGRKKSLCDLADRAQWVIGAFLRLSGDDVLT